MPRTQHTKKRFGEQGFSLIELLIVIVILAVIMPIFGVLLINSYRDAYYLNGSVQASSQMQQALWYMDDNVRVASAFLTSIPSPFTDPYGPNNLGSSGSQAWSYAGTSTTNRVLITQSYATTTTALGNGRQPVFENSGSFDCASQVYYQPELPFVTIYFVNNGTLYRRILTDTTTPLCAGYTQSQKQTCPPYLTGTLNSLCKANDEVLATNVTAFSIAYYQTASAGSDTPVDPNYTQNDISAADYAIATISEKAITGGAVTTMTQRLTKVNH